MNIRKMKGFTLIELMIVVAIIGILAAIAIPNFIKFQARSKVGEARSNMKGLYTAEKGYYQEKDEYGSSFDLVGFIPERGNRYTYRVGTATAANIQTRATSVAGNPTAGTTIEIITGDTFKHGSAISAQQVKSGTVAPVAFASDNSGAALTADTTNYAAYTNSITGGFIGSAMANLDSETTGVDMWYVSNQGSSITSTAGACITTAQDTQIPAGAPGRLYDDVGCGN